MEQADEIYYRRGKPRTLGCETSNQFWQMHWKVSEHEEQGDHHHASVSTDRAVLDAVCARQESANRLHAEHQCSMLIGDLIEKLSLPLTVVGVQCDHIRFWARIPDHCSIFPNRSNESLVPDTDKVTGARSVRKTLQNKDTMVQAVDGCPDVHRPLQRLRYGDS